MFSKHIFICNHRRDPESNRKSCGDKGEELRIEFAQRLAQMGLKDEVRANKCGCLDACELGPVVVIYPQRFWYNNVAMSDIPEIIEKSIIRNKPIKRLMIKKDQWLSRK